MKYFEIIIKMGKTTIYTIAQLDETIATEITVNIGKSKANNLVFEDILHKEYNSSHIELLHELDSVMLTYLLLFDMNLAKNIFPVKKLKEIIKECIDDNQDVSWLLSIVEDNRGCGYFYKNDLGHYYPLKTVEEMIEVAIKDHEQSSFN